MIVAGQRECRCREIGDVHRLITATMHSTAESHRHRIAQGTTAGSWAPSDCKRPPITWRLCSAAPSLCFPWHPASLRPQQPIRSPAGPIAWPHAAQSSGGQLAAQHL